MAQLDALFVFTGLLSYSAGRLRQVTASGRGWWQIMFACLLCLPLAMFSKENGVLLLLVPLVELLLFRGDGLPAARNGAGRWLLAAMLLPVALGVVYRLLHFDQLVLDGYVSREFTLTERLLTQPRVLAAAGIVLLLSWSSLTVVRAGIWGTASLLATHISTGHPESKHRMVMP